MLTESERREHVCGVNNGNCSHLYVVDLTSSHDMSGPAGARRRCSCPLGMKLNVDGVTCTQQVTCGPTQFLCHDGGEFHGTASLVFITAAARFSAEMFEKVKMTKLFKLRCDG